MNSVKEISNEVPATVASSTTVNTSSSVSSFTSIFDNFSISSFTTTLMSNNMYLYILGIVAVLAFIGYYLYLKYFVNTKPVEEEKPKANEPKKNYLNPTQEYYLIDPSGNPILMNPYFLDILKHHMTQKSGEQPKMEQQQMQQQQMQQQQMQQQMEQQQIEQQQIEQQQMEQQQIQQTKPDSSSEEDSDSTVEKLRPKLSHPGEHMNIPDRIMLTDAEDDNLANQDLNNDEILELKRQLDLMKKNQAYKVSAQNDEDD